MRPFTILGQELLKNGRNLDHAGMEGHCLGVWRASGPGFSRDGVGVGAPAVVGHSGEHPRGARTPGSAVHTVFILIEGLHQDFRWAPRGEPRRWSGVLRGASAQHPAHRLAFGEPECKWPTCSPSKSTVGTRGFRYLRPGRLGKKATCMMQTKSSITQCRFGPRLGTVKTGLPPEGGVIGRCCLALFRTAAIFHARCCEPS